MYRTTSAMVEITQILTNLRKTSWLGLILDAKESQNTTVCTIECFFLAYIVLHFRILYFVSLFKPSRFMVTQT